VVWPPVGESLTYNSIDVSLLSEEKDAVKDVRKFQLVYNRVIFFNNVKSSFVEQISIHYPI